MIYLVIVYFEHVKNPWYFGRITRVPVHGGVPRVTAALCSHRWQEQSHCAGGDDTCHCHLFTLQVHRVPPWRGPLRHSQSTLWSCAVPCLWDCAFVPTCFYAVGVLWNESLPLCPQWTITPSNGLESCCACKVSQKHSQKLWPSPNLDRDSGLWIWSIKSLSSSMWKNVPWITVGLTYCACSSYPSADKNFPMFVCPHLNLPPELPAIPALLGHAFGGGRDSSAGSSSDVGLGFSKTRQCSVFITIVWMDLLSSSLSPCCPSVKLRNH